MDHERSRLLEYWGTEGVFAQRMGYDMACRCGHGILVIIPPERESRTASSG